MFREKDTIFVDGIDFLRKDKNSKIIKDIKDEIDKLTLKKERHEKVWNIKINKALLEASNEELVDLRIYMFEEKAKAMNLIEQDLIFWKNELEKEKNRQQPQHKKMKRPKKRRTDLQIEYMVREIIQDIKKSEKNGALTKEEVAYELQVSVSRLKMFFVN